MDDLSNSKSEGIIIILTDLLKQLSEKLDVLDILKEYYLLENTYVGLIKKQHFGSVITQKKLYFLINNYYYNSNNLQNLKNRRIAEKNIKKIFYSFLLSPSFSSLIDKLYADESETIYEMDKYSIIRGIHKTLNDKIIKTIQNTTSYNLIPNFIIYYDKKLLNSKVNEHIKHQYLFNFTDKNQNKIEYKYFIKYFLSFLKNPNIIFSIESFKDEFRKSLFKLIILSNYKYLKNNELAYEHFHKRMINNIVLMKLDKYCKELNEEFDMIMKKEEKLINEELVELKKYIKNELFIKDELNKINNVKYKENLINNSDIGNQFKLNKKFLKLVFSFYVLFNRFVIIKNKNLEINTDNTEENNHLKENILNIDDASYEIKIISKLKCSSIYHRFLLNILNIFEEEDVFLYYYMLDTYIFSDIIKKDNRYLFQKTRAKEKIIINFEEIMEKIKDNKLIKDIFNLFYNENISIFAQPKIKFGFFGNLFNKKIPNSIKTKTGIEINYNINELKLKPIIRGEIYSTQITIILDGPLSINTQLVTNKDELSHKDIFCSFFTNNLYTNSDFYLYDWQSLNYNGISSIKKITKFYGKLLAYIIASREIFSFQIINLIGFSMGCNIIKYCLIELNKINKKINCFDIINNVIFIGGCINIKNSKYHDIFDGVAGKVINIFSKNDKQLIEFNKSSIGLNEIDFPKKNYKIINYNLSKKCIMQEDYFYEIPNILFQNFYLH